MSNERFFMPQVELSEMKASIIIPAYNSATTIEETLRSIIEQEGTEFEVIVVDDGSTDNTRVLVEKYPIKLIYQENRGPAAARNNGAKNATGDVLVFTDSDCVVGHGWLSEMLRPFSNLEVVGVQGKYQTRQDSLIARFTQYEIEERYEKMAKKRYIDFLGSYSAAYKKEVFLEEGGFDENYPIASGEDPDLSYRLFAKDYKMVFNPRAIVYHRHPDSLYSYLNRKFYRAYWRVPLYKKNKKKALSDSYTLQTLKLQIAAFYLLLPAVFVPKAFAALAIALLASTLPSSTKMFKKDRMVGVIAPLVIVLRTIVFASGLMWGILNDKGMNFNMLRRRY